MTPEADTGGVIKTARAAAPYVVVAALPWALAAGPPSRRHQFPHPGASSAPACVPRGLLGDRHLASGAQRRRRPARLLSSLLPLPRQQPGIGDLHRV